MESPDVRILGLSKKEGKVLFALQDEHDTPLALSRATKVSRPAVYAILLNLKKRGLVRSHITDGRKSWALSGERDIEKVLYAAKRALLKIPEGREEIHGASDSAVVVHRGVEAIKRVVFGLFAPDAHEQFFFWGFQGDVSTIGWNKVFTVDETNRINRHIKEKGMVVRAVLPRGWLEEQTKLLGVAWAKDFEGRTTQVNIIDPKYFQHGGQCWIFKNRVFLFALNEEIIIEVRNSEIQKMILSIFEFMQDNSPSVDANELLRGLIAKSDAYFRRFP